MHADVMGVRDFGFLVFIFLWGLRAPFIWVLIGLCFVCFCIRGVESHSRLEGFSVQSKQ